MQLNSQDFSFVGEESMSILYQLLRKNKIQPNLIQTGAINVQICLDNHIEKIDRLASETSAFFDVQIEKDLQLLTIRHYQTAIFEELTKDVNMVLTQKTKETIQVLYK